MTLIKWIFADSKNQNRGPQAHKLARIIFHLLTTGQSYDESIFATDEQRRRTRIEHRLRRQAKEFGFELVAIPA
jgi:hypothetical protein